MTPTASVATPERSRACSARAAAGRPRAAAASELAPTSWRKVRRDVAMGAPAVRGAGLQPCIGTVAWVAGLKPCPTIEGILLPAGDLCLEDDAVVGELLDDGQQARVEEAHLKKDQEGQRAVDAVRQRVEDRE